MKNTLLHQAKHPVLIFANGYGDHYLNLPALRAFSKIFDGKLTLVGIKGVINQVAGDLNLHNLVQVPMQYSDAGRKFDVEEAVKKIGDCDFFISLNPWVNDEIEQLLLLLNPKHSLGFFDVFEFHIPRAYSKHAVDLAFDCVQLLEPNWRPSMFSAPPTFPQNDNDTATAIWSALAAQKKVLCLHVDTLPEKMWPEESWQSFIDLFLDHNPNFSVLIVGMNGINISELRNEQRVISACGLSITVSGLLLSRCSVFVGIDSVFLHISDLFAVPSIGLFGPTDPAEWGIRFGPGCHLSKTNMKEIDVQCVLKSVERYIVKMA